MKDKIKIPKNWVFKYFEVEGNTTKFVYEDQLGIEHIYIDEKPEPELPTYEELEKELKEADEAVEYWQKECDKRSKVLDKIRKNNARIIDYGFDYDGFNNVEDLKKLIDMLVDYAKQNDKLLGEIE